MSLIEENNICFEEVPIHDDTKFCYLTGHLANKIKVDKRAIYCISYSKKSLSYTLTDEKFITRMHVIGKRDQFIKNLGLNLGCTGNFIKRTLVEIRESGRNELYRKCVNVLKDYDIDPTAIDKEIRNIIRKKKKDNTKKRIKMTIKHYIFKHE